MFDWLKRLAISHGYIANYGYTDGSGDFYIVLDSDKCTGCNKCVEVCPPHILEDYIDDYDCKIVKVMNAHSKSIKYDCGPCVPVGSQTRPPCEVACEPGAIKLSFKLKE